MLIAFKLVKESIFIVKSMFGDERSKNISLSPQIFLLFCSRRVSTEHFLVLWPLHVHENFHSNDTPIHFTYYTTML